MAVEGGGSGGFQGLCQLAFQGLTVASNLQHAGDVMDFYRYGDAAPGGRFNYIYRE